MSGKNISLQHTQSLNSGRALRTEREKKNAHWKGLHSIFWLCYRKYFVMLIIAFYTLHFFPLFLCCSGLFFLHLLSVGSTLLYVHHSWVNARAPLPHHINSLPLFSELSSNHTISRVYFMLWQQRRTTKKMRRNFLNWIWENNKEKSFSLLLQRILKHSAEKKSEGEQKNKKKPVEM